MKNLIIEECYIAGKWISSDKKIDVTDPATGLKIGTIPNLGSEETRQAIQAAEATFHEWKTTPAKVRYSVLMNWYNSIMREQDKLSILLTTEQGKPLQESRKEIAYAASFIQWFAEEAKRIEGNIISSSQKNTKSLVVKQSIGVVGAITPWNFPCLMVTRKVAPAIAAGCTVVLKPSELTPYSALILAALGERVGLPPGVLNIITGEAETIGKVMASHSAVKKISFTGSTSVGKRIMKQSADTVKKVTLELGGNAPFIVFEDADLDSAVEAAVRAKYRNAGQTCVCVNRFFVHSNVYDQFADKLKMKTSNIKVGNGIENTTNQGPLINEHAVSKVKRHVDDAISRGAKLLLGGKQHPLGNNFYEPTILGDVPMESFIFHEETFGPVSALFRFSSVQDVIKMANNTNYGLASYFCTRDISKIVYVAEALEYGIVSINEGIFSNEIAPFGGIKESGIGKEGSKYGIEEYLETKYICLGGLKTNFV